MKKSIILSLIAVCLIFTFIESALSQETLTHGCYNWRSGTLRIVANPNQCNPRFENYIPWHKAIPPGGFTIDLYVNGASGEDLPARGLTPADPFETITYALQQLIYLRPTQEIETIINVAPGIYNENLFIKEDNIQVKKNESFSGGVIIDGVGQDVIAINSAKNIIISDLTIQNGNNGIRADKGAAVDLINVLFQDNTKHGIVFTENSNTRITDCTVLRSGKDGIRIYSNSMATFLGAIGSSSSQNGGAGIRISYSSSAIFDQSKVTASENVDRGITISHTSSLLSYQSTVISSNNENDGVVVYGSSSIASSNNDTWVTESNDKRGITVSGSSRIYINPG